MMTSKLIDQKEHVLRLSTPLCTGTTELKLSVKTLVVKLGGSDQDGVSDDQRMETIFIRDNLAPISHKYHQDVVMWEISYQSMATHLEISYHIASSKQDNPTVLLIELAPNAKKTNFCDLRSFTSKIHQEIYLESVMK